MTTASVTRQELHDEMAKLRDTLDRWRAPIQDKVDKHHITLFGNGKPGMDEDLRQIKTFISEMKTEREAERKERRETQIYYFRLTVGAALSSLVILILNGVVWFVKILPVLDSLTKAKP